VPGWRVWVNGAPSVLHGADAAFMAVALPAGAVTVRWVWSPAALRVGLFLALGALGVLAGWASAWRARV
jgi:hypothetical protein